MSSREYFQKQAEVAYQYDIENRLTAEGQLFSYLRSETGRYYDLTEYVNDTNRQYTQVLTAYTVNSGATESYSYAGDIRNSRNNIRSRDAVRTIARLATTCMIEGAAYGECLV